MIIDIYSRYVPGWLLAPRESAALAEQLLGDDPPAPHHYEDGKWCACTVLFDIEATQEREGPPAHLSYAPPQEGQQRGGLLRRLLGR